MKTSATGSLLAALALMAISAVGASGSPAGPETKGIEISEHQTNSPGQKNLLEKGMKADEIVNLIGMPSSVAPLKMDTGKAEKWTYRKLLGETVTQDATSIGSEAAFVGNGGPGNNSQGSRQILQYSMKHITTYQVTALLMINDQLTLAKQWNEREVSYEQ